MQHCSTFLFQRSKPRTVDGIMQQIGFPQYTSSLLANGWDDLEFLRDLAEDDLTEAGVPKEHQRMVRLHTCTNQHNVMSYYKMKTCLNLTLVDSWFSGAVIKNLPCEQSLLRSS